MWPRRYFPAAYFAPVYWSQSQGVAPVATDSPTVRTVYDFGYTRSAVVDFTFTRDSVVDFDGRG